MASTRFRCPPRLSHPAPLISDFFQIGFSKLSQAIARVNERSATIAPAPKSIAFSKVKRERRTRNELVDLAVTLHRLGGETREAGTEARLCDPHTSNNDYDYD
jgi:hypothetical protein